MTPYRHTLTRRESGQWNHINPNMARWRQGQIVERISDAAIEAGFEEWELWTADERRLAWGCETDKWISPES